MSRKLVLHVGYPKAASTTMQNNVFLPLHQSQQINFLGRAYESQYAGVAGKSEFKDWTEQIIAGGFPGKGAYHMALPEIVDNKVNVLSENRFLIHYALNGDRKILANLKSYFQDHTDSIDVVLILRAQPAVIFSWYLQRYRRITQKTFGKFIRYQHAGNWHDGTAIFNYFTTMQLMKKIFGASKVHVVLFEDLVNAPEGFSRQWARLMAVSEGEVVPLLAKPSKNVTPRVVENGEVEKFVPKKQPKPSIYERFLINAGVISKRVVSLEPMTPDQENQIRGDFRDSNIRLAEQFGLDQEKLEKYGYI